MPDDAAMARVSTFQADYDASVDLDIFVYQKVGEDMYYLGASAAGGSDESATLPGGATYVFYVDYWGGTPDSIDVKLNSWVVTTDEGNLAVDPASQSVTTSEAFSATATWADLEEGTRYLGAIVYTDGDGQVLTSTTINVIA